MRYCQSEALTRFSFWMSWNAHNFSESEASASHDCTYTPPSPSLHTSHIFPAFSQTVKQIFSSTNIQQVQKYVFKQNYYRLSSEWKHQPYTIICLLKTLYGSNFGLQFIPCASIPCNFLLSFALDIILRTVHTVALVCHFFAPRTLRTTHNTDL